MSSISKILDFYGGLWFHIVHFFGSGNPLFDLYFDCFMFLVIYVSYVFDIPPNLLPISFFSVFSFQMKTYYCDYVFSVYKYY